MTSALPSSLQPPALDTAHYPDPDNWRDLKAYDRTIFHQRHRCPVFSWLTQARLKRNKKTQCSGGIRYILYAEYRLACQSSHYLTLTFTSLEQACHYQQTRLALCPLPGISPEQTRRHPIKPTESNVTLLK